MADRFSGTIMVEGGEVFLGTLEQFEENFFANADPAAIIAWADDHKWNVRFFDTDPASAFTTAVMSAVGSRVDLSMVDKEDIILTVHSGIPSMFREGFSVADAVKYLLCMEHFNPELDEEVALARMFKIRKKYVKDLVAPDYVKSI